MPHIHLTCDVSAVTAQPARRVARPSVSGRWKIAVAVLWAALSNLGMTSSGSAQAASVPASLQAELLAKLETYDRAFAKRAGTTARVLIVAKTGSAKSELSANEMRS